MCMLNSDLRQTFREAAIVSRRRVSAQHIQLISSMHSNAANTINHQYYEITIYLFKPPLIISKQCGIILKIRGYLYCRPGYLSRYSDSLRAGRSGDRIPVSARNSAPVQISPEAHPASYKVRTGSFPGVKWPGRGVDPPPSSAKVKEKVELYFHLILLLLAFLACSRVNLIFIFTFICTATGY